MLRHYLHHTFLFILCAFTLSEHVWAVADPEVNTPAIATLKSAMQQRHQQLAPHYASGAIWLTRDEQITMRNAAAITLANRQSINALVAAENQDRNTLYREVASANAHPEWEQDMLILLRYVGYKKRKWIGGIRTTEAHG